MHLDSLEARDNLVLWARQAHGVRWEYLEMLDRKVIKVPQVSLDKQANKEQLVRKEIGAHKVQLDRLE